MTTPKTCTVVVTGTGGTCGAPAVTTFTSRSGKVYAECAEHAVEVAPAAPTLAPGATVEVVHIGIAKVGTVEKVGPANVVVRVPIGSGPTATTKIITRPIAAVVPVNGMTTYGGVQRASQAARARRLEAEHRRHVASTSTTRQAVQVTAGQTVRIADGPKAGHEGRVDTVRHCVQMGSLIPLVILDFADGSRSVRAASSPVEVLS